MCVLIFVRIVPNLHIASKGNKLIPTNKILQFTRVNLPSVNVDLIGDPTYLFNHLKIIKFCSFT